MATAPLASLHDPAKRPDMAVFDPWDPAFLAGPHPRLRRAACQWPCAGRVQYFRQEFVSPRCPLGRTMAIANGKGTSHMRTSSAPGTVRSLQPIEDQALVME
jgi:hypothetical protein